MFEVDRREFLATIELLKGSVGRSPCDDDKFNKLDIRNGRFRVFNGRKGASVPAPKDWPKDMAVTIRYSILRAAMRMMSGDTVAISHHGAAKYLLECGTTKIFLPASQASPWAGSSEPLIKAK